MRIIVSESVLGANDGEQDEALLDEVTDAVEEAQAWDVPASALSDYAQAVGSFASYVAQVNNGGHAQFVGNAGSGKNARRMLKEVILLTQRAGFGELERIATDARDWVIAHPDEADQQTGFGSGIAPTLAALDEPFYALGNPMGRVADWLRRQPDIEGVADKNVNEIRASVRKEWIANTPFTQAAIAETTAEKLRGWFADPIRVGLALAAGDGNKARLVSMQLGLPGYALFSTRGSGQTDICSYEFVDGSITVTQFMEVKGERGAATRPIAVTRPIVVEREKIERVQRLALEFQMPESLGLRWWRTRQKLDMSIITLYELPKWSTGKFWLRLIGDDWMLKGSPEKSTFEGPGVARESLMQEDIVALWAARSRLS